MNNFFSDRHRLKRSTKNRTISILKLGKYKIRRYKLIRSVNQKINRLKETNSFKPFPLNSVTPIVSKYTFYRKGDRRWLDFFYSVYGRPIPDFIPLTIYYQIIEPKLNQYALLQAIKEKNIYNKFFPYIKTPRTILRRINGGFYDADYATVNLNDEWVQDVNMAEHDLIMKPSIESGAGKRIMRFVKNGHLLISDNNVLNINLFRSYNSDFIIQETVKQHRYFRHFNPESNNTLRVFTYRSVETDQVSILHTLLRIGKKGEFMDHDNLGGVAIAVDNDGNLQSHAFDVNGIKYRSFNGVKFVDVQDVPSVKKVWEISVKIASEIYYGRLLAFDFTVNVHGDPLLIEINCQNNGVSQYQMNNGSLFREYTKEILDYCEEQ